MTYIRESQLMLNSEIEQYLNTKDDEDKDYRLIFYDEIVKDKERSMVTTVWEVTAKKKKFINL